MSDKAREVAEKIWERCMKEDIGRHKDSDIEEMLSILRTDLVEPMERELGIERERRKGVQRWCNQVETGAKWAGKRMKLWKQAAKKWWKLHELTKGHFRRWLRIEKERTEQAEAQLASLQAERGEWLGVLKIVKQEYLNLVRFAYRPTSFMIEQLNKGENPLMIKIRNLLTKLEGK